MELLCLLGADRIVRGTVVSKHDYDPTGKLTTVSLIDPVAGIDGGKTHTAITNTTASSAPEAWTLTVHGTDRFGKLVTWTS